MIQVTFNLATVLAPLGFSPWFSSTIKKEDEFNYF